MTTVGMAVGMISGLKIIPMGMERIVAGLTCENSLFPSPLWRENAMIVPTLARGGKR